MCAIDRMPSPLIEAFDNTPSATNNSVREEITARLDDIKNGINSSQLNYDTSEKAINDFINGIPSNSADAIIYINSKMSQLDTNLSAFKKDIIEPLYKVSDEINKISNVNTAANDLNEKMTILEELKSKLDGLGTDLSTAYTREAVVDTKDAAVSYQQTWGMLQRPIRRQSIPVLIVFSLLFLTAAGIGIWYLSPFAVQSITETTSVSPILWFGGIGVVVCVVIYGILALLKLL